MATRVDFQNTKDDPKKIRLTMADPVSGQRCEYLMDLVALQEFADLVNAALLQFRGYAIAR